MRCVVCGVWCVVMAQTRLGTVPVEKQQAERAHEEEQEHAHLEVNARPHRAAQVLVALQHISAAPHNSSTSCLDNVGDGGGCGLVHVIELGGLLADLLAEHRLQSRNLDHFAGGSLGGSVRLVISSTSAPALRRAYL